MHKVAGLQSTACTCPARALRQARATSTGGGRAASFAVPPLILLLALAACSNLSTPVAGGEDQVPVGEAAAGRQVFAQISTRACGSCHSLEPGKVIVGPSLGGIGLKARYRAPGLSAAEFLQQSIVEPDAAATPGFAPGVMPMTYAAQLTEEQLADLVAFMLSLE